MSQLKPCPFCGASGATYYHPLNYSQGHMECEECAAFGPCCGMTEGIVDSVYLRGLSRTDAKSQAQERWNRRASPWVRVKDRLPEHGERVFVRNGDIILTLVFNKELNIFMSRASSALHHALDTATHWMPIPPLPEGENK